MLRDIILFGVSVGVLCLYFAFLLYEWFLNKKKMRAETDKTYIGIFIYAWNMSGIVFGDVVIMSE